MRVYDSKGRLIVDFKLHADKHTKGGADEVSLAASQITSERFGKTRLEWTAAKLLKGAGAGADPTEIDVPEAGGLAIFGDGSDGDVTISSITTLTRDMFYNNLTVDAGVTLNPGGYRIFVKGTLTNNGTIARNGNDASGSSGAAALSAGTLGGSGKGGDAGDTTSGGGGGGAGAIFISAKTIDNNGTISANGGDGVSATGSGNNAAGQAGGAVNPSLGGSGGTGGGDNNGPAGAGGTAAQAKSGGRALPVAISGWETYGTAAKIGSGGGGGGGGSDSGYGSGFGGGGGGGGTLLFVYNSASWATEQVNGGAAGGNYGAGGYGRVDPAPGSAGNIIKIANA